MEVTDLDKLQLMKNELTPSCCFGCQHMDGSYCVKPLKQKQVVSATAFFSAFLPPFMTTFFNSFKHKDMPKLHFEVAPSRDLLPLLFTGFLSLSLSRWME